MPPVTQPLHNLDHELIRKAQTVTSYVEAGTAERIDCLKDRPWYKVKTGRHRGAAICRLPDALPPDARGYAIWLTYAGIRREGDRSDFYAELSAAYGREMSSDWMLPVQWDWERLRAERALQEQAQFEHDILESVARSATTMHVVTFTFQDLLRSSISINVRVTSDETFVLVGFSWSADEQLHSDVLNVLCEAGIHGWAPEPGNSGLVKSLPPHVVVYSTIIETGVLNVLLNRYGAD